MGKGKPAWIHLPRFKIHAYKIIRVLRELVQIHTTASRWPPLLPRSLCVYTFHAQSSEVFVVPQTQHAVSPLSFCLWTCCFFPCPSRLINRGMSTLHLTIASSGPIARCRVPSKLKLSVDLSSRPPRLEGVKLFALLLLLAYVSDFSGLLKPTGPVVHLLSSFRYSHHSLLFFLSLRVYAIHLC